MLHKEVGETAPGTSCCFSEDWLSRPGTSWRDLLQLEASIIFLL